MGISIIHGILKMSNVKKWLNVLAFIKRVGINTALLSGWL